MSSQVGSLPRIITTGIVTYAIATYGSYKYSAITKAQSDIRDIKDQRAFLHQKHDEIAEKYDSMYD